VLDQLVHELHQFSHCHALVLQFLTPRTVPSQTRETRTIPALVLGILGIASVTRVLRPDLFLGHAFA